MNHKTHKLSPAGPYTDTRLRIDYVLPCGLVVPVIHDHGDIIRPTVSFECKDRSIVDARLRDPKLAWTRAPL